jgi:hypothetical protein
VPILAVVATLFTGSARADVGHSCTGTILLGKDITGKACVSAGEVSGIPESSTHGSIVTFSQTPAHFAACIIYYDFEYGPNRSQGSLSCYKQANLHAKSQPTFGGECRVNDPLQWHFYLVYRQRFTPDVVHRTQTLSATATCVY